MGVVDVYFYNYNIYNLEDLSLLGKLPTGDSVALYEYFKLMEQQYNIKLAIMGFNQLLRNAVYAVFPKVSIIIDPLDVIKMINKYLGCDEFAYDAKEEIAASIEDQELILMGVSCQEIYCHNSKKEAIRYYKQWQGDVPLGIKCFHNVIRTIDYYYEEIFNYFEFKSIFNEKTPIR